MKHLTPEQLSALHDGALAGRDADEAARHLASCDACRAALAEIAGGDAALAAALVNDPGDAFFERLAERIDLAVEQEAAAPARRSSGLAGAWAWLMSPRGLALGGAAAVVVAGAAVVLITSRQVGIQSMRSPEIVARDEQVAPANPPVTQREAAEPRATTQAAPREEAGEGATLQTSEELALDRAADRDAGARSGAADSRVVEEQRGKAAPTARATRVQERERAGEPRQDRAPAPTSNAPAPPPAPVASKAQATRAPAKPEAAPLAAAPSRDAALQKESNEAKKVVTTRDAVEGADRSAPGDAGLAARAGTTQTQPMEVHGFADTGNSVGRVARQNLTSRGATARYCGVVRDPSGRAVAGAQAVLSDLGLSTRTGADGRFCFDAPSGDHTLTVMAVGFETVRRSIRIDGAAGDAEVTLRSVDVLRGGRASEMRFQVPAVDSFAAWPAALRDPARRAQQKVTLGLRDRSAGVIDQGAAEWERVVERARGGDYEVAARERLGEARYLAWESGPTSARAKAAIETLTSYLTRAPGGPARERAAQRLDRVRQ